MLRHSRVHGAACVLATLGVLAGAGQAAAQSDGVHVDPDSPAGKEYALPLDRAREDVAPAPDAGTTGSGDSDEAPLFGAGISKRDGAEDRRRNSGNDNGQSGQGEGQSGGETGGGAAGGSVTAAVGTEGSALSSGWLTALVALGVLLVGGVAGLSLRALRSTEQD